MRSELTVFTRIKMALHYTIVNFLLFERSCFFARIIRIKIPRTHARHINAFINLQERTSNKNRIQRNDMNETSEIPSTGGMFYQDFVKDSRSKN